MTRLDCSWAALKALTLKVLANVTMEPLMFVRSVGHNAFLSVWTNLKIDKVCRTGTNWFGNGTDRHAKVYAKQYCTYKKCYFRHNLLG